MRASDSIVSNTADESAESAKHSDHLSIHRLAHISVVNTIEMVYKEWYHGWDQRPSIKSLIETYGDRWRDKADKKLFSRRNKIILELNRIINQEGISEEEAIKTLEIRRNKRAVSTFADSIKIIKD